MANSFWNFVTQLIPNTLAKAEDPNTSFEGIEAGFDLVEAQTLQSIKVTNVPGVINISSTPANRANKIVSFDGAGGVLASIYIGNYRGNHVAVAGTVYNVRDTVKDSTGALGQDNIYICNTTHTSTGDLLADTANWDILVDVAAVAASAAAALVSENNAAASFTSFDNRYLGAKATDPTLDNSGGALIDGATYFDTTLNRMKVYDLGTTTWSLTTANAADVNISDAGALFTATEVEAALQEVMNTANSASIISAPPITTGTSTAYTAILGITAYVAGTTYKARIHVSNTGSPTIAFDGLSATLIKIIGGAGVIADELPLNHIAELYYDGTFFVLLNPAYISGTNTVTLAASTSGTITISATGANDEVEYKIENRLCHIQARLAVDSILSPVGFVQIVGALPYVSRSGLLPAHFDIPYASLAGAGLANGMVGSLSGTAINVDELTATGIDTTTTAALMQGFSALNLNFSYLI